MTEETDEIEVSCFDKVCKDCPDHAKVSGKVVCNKDNRLGLRSAKIADFLR